jgi:hypothetical protein
VRYLSHKPAKNLSPGERDALHAAGLAVGLVWETTASRTLGGYAAGRADGFEANRQADALGYPKDRAVFYAVDFDATVDQVAGSIADYFRGVTDLGGRPAGVYGSYRVIEGIVGGGRARWGWQCAAWSGPGTGSGGSIRSGYAQPVRLSRHTCLFQHYGLTRIVPPGATDHNTVLMDPTPWSWHPDQTATPDEEDDDMATTIIATTQQGSRWFVEEAGGAEGGQGIVKMLSTDQFVRPMAPNEVTGHLQLRDWIVATGGKDYLSTPGEVPDWVLTDRTYLPRRLPSGQADTVVSLTPDQLAELAEQLGVRLVGSVAADLEQLAAATAGQVADELAQRLET